MNGAFAKGSVLVSTETYMLQNKKHVNVCFTYVLHRTSGQKCVRSMVTKYFSIKYNQLRKISVLQIQGLAEVHNFVKHMSV